MIPSCSHVRAGTVMTRSWRGLFPMASKRSRKVKKRQKAEGARLAGESVLVDGIIDPHMSAEFVSLM